ncbi:hypothetical protein CGGC5_v017038 [Colletotrichum fructicola Nara gc5]|uniref:Uncharacterized protein n=1 Tax=Colletotrichum fructicola (strain Nara gc5) TaxID=1213859 RepID=A0A7J6ID30_COLFN|nr:hypothetical protein CGGC5_v017038 [Colletotrichum fructicola Nara gc5]
MTLSCCESLVCGYCTYARDIKCLAKLSEGSSKPVKEIHMLLPIQALACCVLVPQRRRHTMSRALNQVNQIKQAGNT